MAEDLYHPGSKKTRLFSFAVSDDDRKLLAKLTHARRQTAAAVIRALIAEAAEHLQPPPNGGT